MSQGIPPGYVLPTPQRAKLVGTLNIVFASLLLLYILFQISMLLLMPMIMRMSGDMVKQAREKVEQQRKDQMAGLKKQVAEAKTEEEKAQIEQQITALERSPTVPMPNMSVVTDTMKDPGYQAYVWTDMISGLALNVAMFISGIGLLQLSETSRRLALWTFALKILRLCILSALMIVIIIPMTSRMTSEMMAGMPQRGPGGLPPAMMGDMAKFQAAIGAVQAVLGAVFGSIWPIIGIILLTRRGTRAACLARASLAKPRIPDQGVS
jgi:hypothetical protein